MHNETMEDLHDGTKLLAQYIIDNQHLGACWLANAIESFMGHIDHCESPKMAFVLSTREQNGEFEGLQVD